MVRLVFRPYTQVRKAICTSAHLRASTRVSSGFALLRHSSPSFGSQHTDSDAILSQKLMVGRGCGPQQPSPPLISLRLMGLPPTGSHACCTPWSVFQDGHIEGLLPASEKRSSRRTEALRNLDRPDGIATRSKGDFLPPQPVDAGSPPENSCALSDPGNTGAICDLQCLPPQQFQALFNSLFKVLFIFPSRYLFAIGLPSIFSLRWDLPPSFCCIPKQQDSPKAFRGAGRPAPTGFSPSRTLPSRRLGRRLPQKPPR